MKFIGNLTNTELSKMIEKLASNTYTGTLTVSDGDIRKTFYFEGVKNMVSEIAVAHQMKLGELLLSYEKITQEHIDYVVGQQPHNKKLSGQFLIELGYCTQADIDDALRAQIQLDILELAGWEGAELEFLPEVNFPQTVPPEQGTLCSVLMDIPAMFEVVKQRIQDWKAIETSIPSLKSLLKIDKKEAITEEMKQGNTKKILQLCDGRNRIVDIVQLLKMSRFDICNIFCSLLASQIVRQATFDEVLGIIKIFESTKRNEKAVAFLEYAAHLDPENIEIVEKLARNFEEAKDLKKAAKYYAELAKIRKKELNMPEFEQHIRKAISLDKKEPAHRQILIQYFLERDKLDEAAEAARHLAALYFEMESNEAAENLCELFFDKDQYSVEFRKMLINHYLRLKDKNKASAQYEKLIELASDDKQKMEYYLKILSIDPARSDIRKKMSSLGMKQLLNQYKWLIIGVVAFFFILGATVFYLRRSAYSKFESAKAYTVSKNLASFDIAIQKLTPLKDSFWVSQLVQQEIEAIIREKATIEEKISYTSYQNEIAPLRKLFGFSPSPKTPVTEKMIQEKISTLEMIVLEETEKQAGKLQNELKERIGTGEELEKGKSKMMTSVWQVYQTEVNAYYKLAYEERFGRINKEKKALLDTIEKFITDTEATLKTKERAPLEALQLKIPELTEKIQEAIDKCSSQDPFKPRYEEAAKNLKEKEKELDDFLRGGAREKFGKMLIEADGWADPDGAANLERAIKLYQEVLETLKKEKAIDEQSKQTFQKKAQLGIENCTKTLENLQKDTLSYQESLKKNTDKMNEAELQDAYSKLNRLLKNPWFNYWQEKLRAENKPLLAFHWIETAPSHAFIYVDENLIGRSPRFHRFELNEYPVYRAQYEGFVPYSTTIAEDKPWFIKLTLEKLPLWTISVSKKCTATPAVIQDQYLLLPQAPEILNLELQPTLGSEPKMFGIKKILGNIDSFGAPLLVVDEKFIFTITTGGMLYKMDRTANVLTTLQVQDKSKKPIKIQHANAMAAYDKFLYVAGTKGIAVIDISTKELVQKDFWATSGDFNGVSTGLLIHKSRLFFGCEDQSFYMFQLGEKGLEIGTKKTLATKYPTFARLSAYENYVVATNKKFIYGFDLELNKIWEFDIEPEGDGGIFRGAPVVAADSDASVLGRVFAVNEDGDFYCVALKTGEAFWKGSFNTATAKGAKTNPLLVDTIVYVACDDGQIIAKNVMDEKANPPLFRYNNYEGFSVSPIHIPSKKIILFIDNNKRIISFEQ